MSYLYLPLVVGHDHRGAGEGNQVLGHGTPSLTVDDDREACVRPNLCLIAEKECLFSPHADTISAKSILRVPARRSADEVLDRRELAVGQR